MRADLYGYWTRTYSAGLTMLTNFGLACFLSAFSFSLGTWVSIATIRVRKKGAQLEWTPLAYVLTYGIIIASFVAAILFAWLILLDSVTTWADRMLYIFFGVITLAVGVVTIVLAIFTIKKMSDFEHNKPVLRTLSIWTIIVGVVVLSSTICLFIASAFPQNNPLEGGTMALYIIVNIFLVVNRLALLFFNRYKAGDLEESSGSTSSSGKKKSSSSDKMEATEL